MRYVLDAASMKNVDSYSINTLGIPSVVLMERAALSVTEAIESKVKGNIHTDIICVCGRGNNGADGLAVARQLYLKGYNVDVYIINSHASTKEFDIQLNIIKNLGIECINSPDFSKYGVIVDALFGNGLSRELAGEARIVVDTINKCSTSVRSQYTQNSDNNGNRLVVAVDIPSGISASTGVVMGSAVNADITVTFGFEKIGHFFATQGTTSWLSSILTDTKEQTLKTINEAVKHQEAQKNGHENCADLLGIHLEGPFLAPEYKGAMPEHLLISPDLELLKEYQKAADGNIRYITVSPEVKGVPEAIKGMTDLGMKVAIGHSGADYETSWKCINEGAVAATHTFNAMKLLHQHFPAIMGAVLESDIYCEAICDGRHLHPGTVRFLLKMKGLDKVIAITDSIMAAGLPDGEYMLGVNPVIVKDGDAKLKYGDSRAGSTLTTGCALKNLIKFTGRSLEEILPLLTCNPAKMLDVYDRIGSLDTGKDADVVILDEEYSVIDTFVKGRKIEQ